LSAILIYSQSQKNVKKSKKKSKKLLPLAYWTMLIAETCF